MTECRCSRRCRDDRYLCDTCTATIERIFAEGPWLDDQLDTTIARQRGIDYRSAGGSSGGTKPAERPLPANLGAADARADLRAVLTGVVRYLTTTGGDPRPRPAADDLTATTRWLLGHGADLALLPAAPDIVDEIEDADERCRRIIDRRPDPQYLGECDAPTAVDEHAEPTGWCGGDLYANPGDSWATCRTCGTETLADEVRAAALAKLMDTIGTAAEIARLSTYLGLRLDREAVRKVINQWARREVIVPAIHPDQFRFADVYDRLLALESKRRDTGAA